MAAEATRNLSTPSSSSPITNLADDHLFTILLLLPVDSILSFSMTCKRYKSLATSDSLWEAICEREWGSSSVDALIFSSSSSSSRDGFSWMMMFKRVHKMDSVYCHRISNPEDYDDDDDDDEKESSSFPIPRASHSLNFVNDHLILFGGGCQGGRHLDDTWTSYVDKTNQNILKWKKVESGTPSGRFGHTCIVIGEHLLLFGGINDRGERLNDTWIGQVSYHEGLSWKPLNDGSLQRTCPPPPPRGAHSAACIAKNKMVIHGGIGLNGVRLGDTWILLLPEDFTSGTWHMIESQQSPPPRSGHTLTCIRENQVVLFGGRGLGYDVLDDVWILDIQSEERWIQIFYDFRNLPEYASLPRVGHSATLVLGGRILIYGGEDSYRHKKDDFWIMDYKTIPSSGLQQPQGVSLNGSSVWKKLHRVAYRPKNRSFHRACADCSGRFVYVFGGMVDGLLQPAVSSGLRFDGELFMVELVLGISDLEMMTQPCNSRNETIT